MIDFTNGALLKLGPCPPQEIGPAVAPIVIRDEVIIASFRAVRDFVVFSIETAGNFDLDSELDLWFSGLGKVRLEFRGSVDIRNLGQMIAAHVL